MPARRGHGYLHDASRRGTGQVETRGPPVRTDHFGLESSQQAQRLRVALKATTCLGGIVEGVLAVVPERRMAEVVRQARGVYDIRVAADVLPHLPGDLRHLEGVGEPGPQDAVAPGAGGVYLRLGGQATEPGRVQDPCPVTRERAAARVGEPGPPILGCLVHEPGHVGPPGFRGG